MNSVSYSLHNITRDFGSGKRITFMLFYVSYWLWIMCNIGIGYINLMKIAFFGLIIYLSFNFSGSSFFVYSNDSQGDSIATQMIFEVLIQNYRECLERALMLYNYWTSHSIVWQRSSKELVDIKRFFSLSWSRESSVAAVPFKIGLIIS